jgi:hypothetical protein
MQLARLAMLPRTRLRQLIRMRIYKKDGRNGSKRTHKGSCLHCWAGQGARQVSRRGGQEKDVREEAGIAQKRLAERGNTKQG